MASHLGRPKGKPHPKMRLDPVARRLSELLGREVQKTGDCIGDQVERAAAGLSPGEILLLENLRFHAAEEANDPDFASRLASLCDIYVNDAFGAAHRAHASTEGMARFVPERAAGLLMERELKYLAMAVSAPDRPYVAIVGGAKISGKIDLLESFLSRADRVLIGGAMTYTFLYAQGIEVGASLVEYDKRDVARRVTAEAGDKLLMPLDHVIASEMGANAGARVVDGHSEPIQPGMMGLDIGPATVDLYRTVIAQAKFIVWNGPMGVFEVPPFARGTLEIARAVAASDAVSIIGGGDSEKAVQIAGVAEGITHISTGGGASLEFLAGRKLPGVEALGGIEPVSRDAGPRAVR